MILRHIKEILYHRMAVFRCDAFGVELDAVDGAGGVAQAHDEAVPRFGCDDQIRGHRFAFDDQRVITGRGDRRGKVAEDAVAFVMNGICFAVHGDGGADNVAAEGVADALVAEAYAEQGNLSFMRQLDEVEANASLFRPARPGRENDMRRV